MAEVYVMDVGYGDDELTPVSLPATKCSECGLDFKNGDVVWSANGPASYYKCNDSQTEH